MDGIMGDDRGYIKVISKHTGEQVGYIGSIDRGSYEFKVVKLLEHATRYMQEDTMFHDICWIQGYMGGEGLLLEPKMPFSEFNI